MGLIGGLLLVNQLILMGLKLAEMGQGQWVPLPKTVASLFFWVRARFLGVK